MAPWCVLVFALSIFQAAIAGTPNQDSVSTCCRNIGRKISGSVLFPQNAPYAAVNEDRWSETAILQPACIVLPTSANGVSTSVKVLTKNNCPFAVKSGGHTSFAGANDIDGGVSMDLSWLNQTILSADQTYASIGGGSTWGSMYETLEAKGMAAPGGLCYGTGVGGLTLGGGVSIFSPKTGFTADAVKNFQVVLATGEIVDANQQSHSDLFKALKGGSGNFGIVTRFDISTLNQGQLFGGMVYNQNSPANLNTTMAALSEITTENNNDQDAAYAAIFSHNATTGSETITHWVSYAQNTPNPSIFKTAMSIQPQLHNTLRSTSVSDLAAEGVASIPQGFRYLMATATFKNDVDALIAVQSATNTLVNKLSDVSNLVFITMYEPLPKVFWQRSAEHGGNVLGLDKVDEDLVAVIIPQWTDGADDERMHEAASQWVTSGQSTAAQYGADSSFVYLNFADQFQDPLGSYGPDTLAFMKQVAEKYDPGKVFQTLAPGGFKLSKGD